MLQSNEVLSDDKLDLLADLIDVTYHSDSETLVTLDEVNIATFSNTQIDFVLTFSNTEYISLDYLHPDWITLRIDENLLLDQIKEEPIDIHDVLWTELPRQMEKKFAEKFIPRVEIATEASTSILGLNMLVQFVLQKSLKSIWGVVNLIQFILFFYLIKANLVAEARQFLIKLKVIALGEFLPIAELTDMIQEAFPQFSSNNFSGVSFLEEMGNTLLISTVLVLVSIALLLIGCITKFNAAQHKVVE